MVTLFLIILLNVNICIADGISLVNNETKIINKTFNSPYEITLDITNSMGYSFYDINFENSSIIEMDTIAELTSGTTLTVNASIVTDSKFLGDVKIKGFYDAQVGIENETINIDVDFNDGLSVCSFTTIKGNKIMWNNLVSDDVIIKNEDTGVEFSSISEGGNYTTNFDTPEVFRYSFYRRGYRFTDICQITVLDDTGRVNNPDFDGLISLDIGIIYDPTSVELLVIERNFSLEFFEQEEGVLTIKNIGTKTAYDVNLYGDWFNFNKNDFDINPGETTAVVFNIKQAKAGISTTNDTDRWYTKNMTITGNFDTITEDFNIFIEYANIENFSDMSNQDTLIYMIVNFCRDNPDEAFCNTDSKVIYSGNGTGDNAFNVTFEQGQVNKFISLTFETMDNIETALNYFIEDKEQYNNNLTVMAKDISDLKSLSVQETEKREESETNWLMITIIIALVIISGLLGFGGYLLNRNKKIEKYKEVV